MKPNKIESNIIKQSTHSNLFVKVLAFPKTLLTYVYFICLMNMSSPKYEGLSIFISDSAMRELVKHKQTIYDVVQILEEGYNSSRKRKQGTIEKWLDKGDKTFNAVIIKDYHFTLKEECWVLIHFGKFTRRKSK